MVTDKLQLDIKNLEIGYFNNHKQISVYKNLTVSFTSGQLVGIVGSNGIGKSTFLRTIAGLQKKLAGDVLINNISIDKLSRSELAKLLSIVLTEKISGFNLTVTDLVSVGRVPYTDSFHKLQHNDIQLISEAIKLCGLNDHKHKLLTELSDGLFQKSMIAKGLAQQTNLILLDEPTAYLDFPSKHQLFELLKQICVKEHKCIIISSHDIDLLIKYASHLLIISDIDSFELIEAKDYKKSVLFSKVTNSYFE